MNWIPSDRNSSSAESRCLVERANRSKRHTTIASNCRLRASSMSLLSSGRESLAPDWPTSTYSLNEVKSSCRAIGPQIAYLQLAALVLRAYACIYSDSHGYVLRDGERKRLVCAHHTFLRARQRTFAFSSSPQTASRTRRR